MFLHGNGSCLLFVCLRQSVTYPRLCHPHYIAEDNLELLAFWLPPSKHQAYCYGLSQLRMWCWDQTQGLMLDRQALYQLSYPQAHVSHLLVFFTVECYSIDGIGYLFTHSPSDGCLCCFQFADAIIKAAVSTHTRVSGQRLVFSLYLINSSGTQISLFLGRCSNTSTHGVIFKSECLPRQALFL